MSDWHAPLSAPLSLPHFLTLLRRDPNSRPCRTPGDKGRALASPSGGGTRKSKPFETTDEAGGELLAEIPPPRGKGIAPMAPFPDRMEPLDASLYEQVVGKGAEDVGFEFGGRQMEKRVGLPPKNRGEGILFSLPTSIRRSLSSPESTLELVERVFIVDSRIGKAEKVRGMRRSAEQRAKSFGAQFQSMVSSRSAALDSCPSSFVSSLNSFPLSPSLSPLNSAPRPTPSPWRSTTPTAPTANNNISRRILCRRCHRQ